MSGKTKVLPKIILIRNQMNLENSKNLTIATVYGQESNNKIGKITFMTLPVYLTDYKQKKAYDFLFFGIGRDESKEILKLTESK